MLRSRYIPVLLIEDGELTKTIQFLMCSLVFAVLIQNLYKKTRTKNIEDLESYLNNFKINIESIELIGITKKLSLK